MGNGAVAAAAMREERQQWSAVRYFRAVREKKVPVLTMLELRRYNCTSDVPPSVGTCEIRALASSVLCVHTCAGEEALTDQDHTGVGNDP